MDDAGTWGASGIWCKCEKELLANSKPNTPHDDDDHNNREREAKERTRGGGGLPPFFFFSASHFVFFFSFLFVFCFVFCFFLRRSPWVVVPIRSKIFTTQALKQWNKHCIFHCKVCLPFKHTECLLSAFMFISLKCVYKCYSHQLPSSHSVLSIFLIFSQSEWMTPSVQCFQSTQTPPSSLPSSHSLNLTNLSWV